MTPTLFHVARRALTVAAPLLVALASAVALGAEKANVLAALKTITAADAMKHVSALADDTFEGREAGSRGSRAAAIYLTNELKACGLRGGAAGGSFYQRFDAGTNLLGFLEGSDPELKKQVIVFAAHYDHVGYGSRNTSYGPLGYIHNGADDNASGVSGLLEVAQATSQLETRPKRSILFALWDGEEKGLLGSEHWIARPTVPLASVVFMFNADMIGRLRNGRLEIIGSRSSAGLRRLVSLQNDDPKVWLDFNWEMKANSDHHTFYSKQIPVLMFFTGLHGDYHRPSDDADKINAQGVEQVSRLFFRTLIELADAPRLAPFRTASQVEFPYTQTEAERPLQLPPGRLGVRWKEKPTPPDAVVVERVVPNSAAVRGGLRPGDRIVRFAGRELVTPADLRSAVLAARNPVTVDIERPGAAEPITLNLELPGSPVRVGISWIEDSAEPRVVMLNRVIPGSPAERAGLKVYDRIYQVSGHNFAGGEEFRRLVNTVEPLELTVEYRGQIRKVLLELPPAEK